MFEKLLGNVKSEVVDPSPLHEIFGTVKSEVAGAAKGLFNKFR